MSTALAVHGVEVWDRLWRKAPSLQRDRELLEREERNPRWALILDALTRSFGLVRGLRTIELGSGRGDVSALLAARGADVTLLDYSDKALDQARERFARLGLTARFVHGDMLGDLEEHSGRFDVSCSYGVIEHFRGAERARTVAAHHRVLRDGGLAVISVPHARCVPYRLWKLYLELRGWWPYGMEIPYAKRELLRLADVAGFERCALHCAGFWQSIGDHWCRSTLRLSTDWVARRSWLDGAIGGTLTLVAWKGRRGDRSCG